MTSTASDPAALPSASFAVRSAGYGIAAAIVVLFAFYGTYFAQTLVPLAPEQAAMAAMQSGEGGLYGVLLRLWQAVAGPSLLAARTFSLLAGILALVAGFTIARRLAGDLVMAAFLVLSFVLYPPLVATMVTATPHALFLLCALGAFALLQASPHGGALVGAGVLAFGGALLHPLGCVVMPLWAVQTALILGQRRAWSIAAAAVAGAALAVLIAPPVSDADVSGAGHGTLLKALALPYAMVIVATGLSCIAALSAETRRALGPMRVLVVLAGPLLAAAVLLGAVALNLLAVGQVVTAAAVTFPLVFLTPWPLIYWVRVQMPQVKNIIAWIAFPVIMYSSFWVVLGPVDPHRFPYSHRQVERPPQPH
ncbi:MAG: hypothetical protein JNM81_17350 [Rhodospirillaceae bacterium]|nr:hypothetical protein [Rhodospirillaceae bacterium]